MTCSKITKIEKINGDCSGRKRFIRVLPCKLDSTKDKFRLRLLRGFVEAEDELIFLTYLEVSVILLRLLL
jgi:hypothetical protein